jgi:hypothetical protein
MSAKRIQWTQRTEVRERESSIECRTSALRRLCEQNQFETVRLPNRWAFPAKKAAESFFRHGRRSMFCVIACRTYRLLYIGTTRVEADAISSDETFCGKGSTLGEAQHKAELGARKKSQTLLRPASPRPHLGPE